MRFRRMYVTGGQLCRPPRWSNSGFPAWHPCVTDWPGWTARYLWWGGAYDLTPKLEEFECERVCALGSAVPDVDELELLHRRSGHVSHGILREAVRNQLVTGVLPDWKFFSTKACQKFKTLCDNCAKAKISRVLFPRSQERDQVTNLRPGKLVGTDVLIMLNVPSREECTSNLFLVDFACKYCWVYPFKKRDEGSVEPTNSGQKL